MTIESPLPHPDAVVRPHTQHLRMFMEPSRRLVEAGYTLTDRNGLKDPSGRMVSELQPEEQAKVRKLIEVDYSEDVTDYSDDPAKFTVDGRQVHYASDSWALPTTDEGSQLWAQLVNNASIEASTDVLFNWWTLPASAVVHVMVYPDDFCQVRPCGVHCTVSGEVFKWESTNLKNLYRNLRLQRVKRHITVDPIRKKVSVLSLEVGDLRDYLFKVKNLTGRVGVGFGKPYQSYS